MRRTHGTTCAGFITLAGCAAASPALGQASFHVMPFVPNAPWNFNSAISADGNVVAGQVDGPVSTTSAVVESYRYTIAGGYQGVGDLPGGLVESNCGGLSPDGVWVFGDSNNGGTFRQPFRWSVATGIQALPLTPDGLGGHANASSFDGSIIVGLVRVSSFATYSARWTPQGVETITPLAGNSVAIDITPDGTYTTGVYRSASGDLAYRWSVAGGLEVLPAPAGISGTEGRAISNDGSVIMGKATVSGGSSDHYFRWTAATGAIMIPDLPGRARALTSISDMNADGSVAVGTSLAFGSVPQLAVIWDAQHGVRDLNSVASALGISLDGYHLNGATGISDDGLVITGNANRPGFADRGYILRLPAPTCYANCDASTTAPVLSVSDFICFLNRFAAGDTYANCDASTATPVLNVLDFVCFQAAFAAGCS